MAKYSKKVSKSLNKVEQQSLPPTSGAPKYHSYRVFLQVQQWKSIDCSFQAEVWGWNLLDTGYFPRSTDLPPAPGELLKNIGCNCATDLDEAAAKSMVWNVLWLAVSAGDQHVQIQVSLLRMKKILVPVMRLHNWRLNAHELRKILMSVGDCLFVCLWGPKCFTSMWWALARGKAHEFLGTFSLPRKHISRPWKVMQGRSRVPNKEM